LLLAALLLAAARPAEGVIPNASRVMQAVADANRVAKRDRTLRLSVDLLRGNDEVVARGELLADPSGRARLELAGRSGIVERHLRTGISYQASRNGESLPAPTPLLPPVALLQAGSAAALETALRTLGAAPEAIALGHAGEHDCYVLGGRLAGPDRGEAPRRAAFWVDLESFQAVRIDRADGVRYRLGPPATLGGLRVPGWIAVEVPGQLERRLVIREAESIRPEARAFDPEWLRTPAAGSAPAPGAAPAAAVDGRRQ
jgi:hypothetical protein